MRVEGPLLSTPTRQPERRQAAANAPRWPATGTHAHRNHRRPNQVATSFPRLLDIQGRDLHVTDLDAVDGTPIIDVGPYFQEMGPRGSVREPGWPAEMLEKYWAERKTLLRRKCP